MSWLFGLVFRCSVFRRCWFYSMPVSTCKNVSTSRNAHKCLLHNTRKKIGLVFLPRFVSGSRPGKKANQSTGEACKIFNEEPRDSQVALLLSIRDPLNRV